LRGVKRGHRLRACHHILVALIARGARRVHQILVGFARFKFCDALILDDLDRHSNMATTFLSKEDLQSARGDNNDIENSGDSEYGDGAPRHATGWIGRWLSSFCSWAMVPARCHTSTTVFDCFHGISTHRRRTCQWAARQSLLLQGHLAR